MRTITSLKGTPLSIKTLDLALISSVTAIAGYLYGIVAITDYYKRLFRTSYTSNDPAEVEKANKILCRCLHLKVQYPDEN